MNVAVVAPQTSRWRSLELAAAALAAGLERAGHRAWLVAGTYHDWREVPNAAAAERSVEGYMAEGNVVRVPAARQLMPPRRIALRDLSKVLMALEERLSLDAVVVLGTGWNGPEEAARWAEVRALAAAGRAALVYVPLAFPHPPAANPVERLSRAMWNAAALPRVLRWVRLVVLQAEEEAAELAPHLKGPTLVSRCWLDPRLAEALDSATPREAFDVAYVGPLEEERSPHLVLEVARRLPRLRFVLAGGGGEAEGLRREASRLPNVRVVEPAPGEEAAVIRSAAVALDLSAYDPLPYFTLAFAHAGVPSVVSRTSAARWHVKDGVTGIHVNDVAAAARAVEELARRPDLREAMGRRAREQACTAEALARQLAERLAAG